MKVPRGRYIGKLDGPESADEREHFMKCPECGAWIDCRDLGQVLEHDEAGHSRPKDDA